MLDPRADLDEPRDILIRDGQIAELGAAGSLSAPEDGELFDATGKHAFPAFVDPTCTSARPARSTRRTSTRARRPLPRAVSAP